MILALHQYRDRIEAGQVLARQLAHYASRVDTLVLGLPRDGVPIACEVATYLSAPLDVFTIHQLVTPDRPDVTLGVIASGGVIALDNEAIAEAGISSAQLAAITAAETARLSRHEEQYRGRRPTPGISGRVVIVVDEGLSTGCSMHAAVIALHRQQPAWLVVAAPVGSHEACADLAQEVHEVVCPLRPESLQSIGFWYDRFEPTSDDEVRACLKRGAFPRG